MEIGLAIIIYVCIPIALAVWLSCLITYSTGQSSSYYPITPHKLLLTILIPLLMAYRGIVNKSLTISGSLLALIVGVVHTLVNYCLLASLLTFYLLGSKATKFRLNRKAFYSSNKSVASTARNWVQVICNGGVATYMAMFYFLEVGCTELPIDYEKHYSASWWAVNAVTAIACCSGDTFASELGPVMPFSQPYLITAGRPVPKGTNGGVSLSGTLASAVGGLVVGIAFYLTLLLTVSSDKLASSPPQWPILLVCTVAGLIGSFIDSLLGATLQYSGRDTRNGCIVEHSGHGIHHISGSSVLDNHSVNFVSSFLTSLVCSRVAFVLWWYVTIAADEVEM